MSPPLSRYIVCSGKEIRFLLKNYPGFSFFFRIITPDKPDYLIRL